MPVLSSMFPGFEFSSSKQTDTVGARRVRKGRASGVPVKSPINGTFSSSRDSYVPIVIPANITHSAFSSRQSVARRRSKTKKNSTFMFFKPRSKDVIEIPSRLTRSPEEQVEIKPSVEILTAEKEGHLHIMIDKDQPPVPLSARSEMAQGQLTPPVTPPHKRLPALPDVQDEGG
ncbi:hypothetical protein M501DRAFT_338542 [Patellaria atrata CBS 101060]|uniref:Uncharacterized protein n=1 Tax=Patellaria atrata CBS 101060 TaxID=1346257 RepID=A0A9P4VNH2_9PEZI|nr:hypothetical protein M501DRAFT_338542 [Patellaria atrata CBS 101060]